MPLTERCQIAYDRFVDALRAEGFHLTTGRHLRRAPELDSNGVSCWAMPGEDDLFMVGAGITPIGEGEALKLVISEGGGWPSELECREVVEQFFGPYGDEPLLTGREVVLQFHQRIYCRWVGDSDVTAEVMGSVSVEFGKLKGIEESTQ